MSLGFSFPKSVRLCSRRQFQRVSQQPTRHFGQWVIIESRHNKYQSLRLGITVTKKYGKAVLRNRFKRVVREAFRLCQASLQKGIDIVVKPRQAALEATPADIQQDLLKLLITKE